MHKILIGIKEIMDPFIFILIILISIFEFFVDRPNLKQQGYARDAKVTALISISWALLAVVMTIIGKTVR